MMESERDKNKIKPWKAREEKLNKHWRGETIRSARYLFSITRFFLFWSLTPSLTIISEFYVHKIQELILYSLLIVHKCQNVDIRKTYLDFMRFGQGTLSILRGPNFLPPAAVVLRCVYQTSRAVTDFPDSDGTKLMIYLADIPLYFQITKVCCIDIFI